MNINVNDNPLLVAPRPVRVTSAYPHFARPTHFKLVASPVEQSDHIKLSDDTENIDEHKQPARVDSSVSSDKDLPSPRASPRYVSIFCPISGAYPLCPALPCSHLPSAALSNGFPCYLQVQPPIRSTRGVPVDLYGMEMSVLPCIATASQRCCIVTSLWTPIQVQEQNGLFARQG